jgi:hypothetical protein
LSSIISSVDGPGVAGDVVDAGQDHHHRRAQRDDILREAHEDLRASSAR